MIERNSYSSEIINTSPSFNQLLNSQWDKNNYLCVGLDTDISKIPASLQTLPLRDALLTFNREIIDSTADLVCAYKPNAAYYEAYGVEGLMALMDTVHYIKENYSTVPVILDAKRGDIGSTNEAYARSIFDVIGADAVTVHPYLGRKSLEPILERKDKGVIVMGANSNEGAGELQDLPVGEYQEPLYRYVAKQVSEEWNANGNCALTASATEPEKIKEIRKVAPSLPLLILGVGAQEGNLDEAVKAGLDTNGHGIIINSSRSVIYASSENDFQMAARNIAEELRAGTCSARSF